MQSILWKDTATIIPVQIHMVRNVTAHELRIRWDIDEAAAVEILQQISFLHKYLDQCIVVKKYM